MGLCVSKKKAASKQDQSYIISIHDHAILQKIDLQNYQIFQKQLEKFNSLVEDLGDISKVTAQLQEPLNVFKRINRRSKRMIAQIESKDEEQIRRIELGVMVKYFPPMSQYCSKVLCVQEFQENFPLIHYSLSKLSSQIERSVEKMKELGLDKQINMEASIKNSIVQTQSKININSNPNIAGMTQSVGITNIFIHEFETQQKMEMSIVT